METEESLEMKNDIDQHRGERIIKKGGYIKFYHHIYHHQKLEK